MQSLCYRSLIWLEWMCLKGGTPWTMTWRLRSFASSLREIWKGFLAKRNQAERLVCEESESLIERMERKGSKGILCAYHKMVGSWVELEGKERMHGACQVVWTSSHQPGLATGSK